MGVGNFFLGWLQTLRWQRLPEMDRLGEFLVRHLEGIASYCFHPGRFGVVESINTTIKVVLRRTRGMRDEQLLLLKLKWAIGSPDPILSRPGALHEPSTHVLKTAKNPFLTLALKDEQKAADLR